MRRNCSINNFAWRRSAGLRPGVAGYNRRRRRSAGNAVQSVPGRVDDPFDAGFGIITADVGVDELDLLTRQGTIDKHRFAIHMGNARKSWAKESIWATTGVLGRDLRLGRLDMG